MLKHETGQSQGCYLCRPDAPDAAQEACGTCDREYWANPIPVSIAADWLKCGARFKPKGAPPLVCTRTGRWHLIHRDDVTGHRFAPLPFGAYIMPAKH